MNKLKEKISVLFFLFFTGLGSASASEFGIVTGGNSGTYIKIGQDISRLMKNNGINLNVHTSTGSLENVFSVFKLPKAQMGIAQSDVLFYISSKQDEALKSISKKIRLLHPLYNEEVHLLAKNDIKSIDDLKGRVVSMGKSGSGTYLTADTIINNLLGVDVKETYYDAAESLKKLKSGEIDAMFYVTGYPAPIFESEVDEGDNLHLVPIQDKELKDYYQESEIPTKTYPWQTSPVETVSVKAVLITFDYKRANCQNVGKMARIIESNVDWLKNNGHKKWHDVDLSFKLPGWVQYQCVNSTVSPLPVDDDYQRYLDALRNKPKR